MGRPRKRAEVSTGKISKTTKGSRIEAERKLKLGREQLMAPAWLQEDRIATTEFVRTIAEYEKIDILDNLDLSLLAIYCKAYSNYIGVTKLIEENGYTITTSQGGEKISPYVTAQERFVNQIMRCSSKLGMATTDRLKLAISNGDDKPLNKFLQYIE